MLLKRPRRCNDGRTWLLALLALYTVHLLHGSFSAHLQQAKHLAELKSWLYPATSEDELCVVVPFRDGCLGTNTSAQNQGAGRQAQLEEFARHFAGAMRKKNPSLKFHVIAAVQAPRGLFREGGLLNHGFAYGASRFNCTYFVLSDVDQLFTSELWDFSNAARHRQVPVHICSNMSQYQGIPYAEFAGGAMMFTREQFERVNGDTNRMEGWVGGCAERRLTAAACVPVRLVGHRGRRLASARRVPFRPHGALARGPGHVHEHSARTCRAHPAQVEQGV
jgi:hypothetical protein